MGLHVGYVERRSTGYVGLEIHRAARVAAAAHGGQLLLTGAARALIGDTVATEPLGLHRLKDFRRLSRCSARWSMVVARLRSLHLGPSSSARRICLRAVVRWSAASASSGSFEQRCSAMGNGW
jgi:hypothetical protein